MQIKNQKGQVPSNLANVMQGRSIRTLRSLDRSFDPSTGDNVTITLPTEHMVLNSKPSTSLSTFKPGSNKLFRAQSGSKLGRGMVTVQSGFEIEPTKQFLENARNYENAKHSTD